MRIKITEGVPRHPDWRMAEPVNLEILDGEQIAIVGDNASGKTRLVEILTGHYPLFRTEVQYDFGPAERRLVSENVKYITFRDSYGEGDRTYYYQQRWNQHDIPEDMPTPRSLLPSSSLLTPSDKSQPPQSDTTSVRGGGHPAQSQAQEAASFQIFSPSLLDKPIVTLSSGELRRFQLTKALLGRPRVLILDNPFIGLDASTRDQLRLILRQLTEQTGILLILVLSRSDDIPDFITHVLPVDSLRLLPKMTRKEFLAQQAVECRPPVPSSSTSATDKGPEIIRLNHVSIRYGNRTILNDLNWTVHEGERWALTGENGSGKSTLLSLVCADNPQSYACDIRLFGRKRGTGESIWDIKRNIGYVSPEMHRAYQRDLPAIDIVASGLSDSVGLYVRPRPEERQQCLRWMRVFGIEELAERTFLRLSSGEQRLCLLARAFVKDPSLLILDEPLHGLDLGKRAFVLQLIEDFAARPHKTLVMVSHYEEELPPCITHRLRLQRCQ